ncbi:MFS transporter [Chamaesiphon sp. VAR_48_metabat_135_sub]|uniref:MFS transporter n=1 Tax=Chamaesiphon sp. VAR_48_metabat_135_sub TaxID=2964699 RepID=UPI00286A5694|nr:MFS transporter [Chamaesiphon sp. VAR_48_metabat_135_sub]
MDLDLNIVNSSQIEPQEALLSTSTAIKRIPASDIRRSLKASSIDGVFAAVFTNLTSGVLLSNFLVNLQASSFEIGILSAIPMLANIVQPFGAWLSDRFNSRLRYCSSIYFPSRFIWVFLLLGIALYSRDIIDNRSMAIWTMVVVAFSHLLGGLGSAAWLSWMAVLVPRQLRGRYFGIRNTAANLTNLIVVAIAGVWVANYPRGELEGFAIALGVGIVAGFISMACQWQMVDINPQMSPATDSSTAQTAIQPASAIATISQDRHFQIFLLYFSLWMFSLNLSAPFFNLYLLQDLSIDLSWVTLYNSLTSAANLALLIPFGRWSDAIGNRIPLLGMGLVMVILPLLWLFVGTDALSLWLGLPLLYMLNGGANAAIDLCINNLQIEISHDRHQAQYFGITAAISGISGALGTVVGGGLVGIDALGGLTGLFVISSILRLLSLIPLIWLQPEGERLLGLKSF